MEQQTHHLMKQGLAEEFKKKPTSTRQHINKKILMT